MSLLPEHVTPEELAEHLGVAERTVREKARELGTCRLFGKKMILLETDVATLMEALKPCPSNCTKEAGSGTYKAPLPVGGYGKARERLTGKSRSVSKRTSKTPHGEVISMGQKRT